MLRLYNQIKKLLKKLNSFLFSLLIFGSLQHITIGRNVNITGKRISIAKGCHVMDNSSILGDIVIRENVFRS